LRPEEIQCESISFHDFTPDSRNLAYQNVLLAHYNTAQRSQSVSAYAIKL
jgi:hypothetical protein